MVSVGRNRTFNLLIKTNCLHIPGNSNQFGQRLPVPWMRTIALADRPAYQRETPIRDAIDFEESGATTRRSQQTDSKGQKLVPKGRLKPGAQVLCSQRPDELSRTFQKHMFLKRRQNSPSAVSK